MTYSARFHFGYKFNFHLVKRCCYSLLTRPVSYYYYFILQVNTNKSTRTYINFTKLQLSVYTTQISVQDINPGIQNIYIFDKKTNQRHLFGR